MAPLRWLLFSCLLFFGGWAALLNWTVPFRKRGGSMIPLCGGGLLAIGFVVAPWDALNARWWLPLVLDLGCIPLFGMTGCYLMWQVVSARRQQRPPVP